ncbi:MAG: Protein GrpE [Chlamydiae bacterium]|nr:Protein GrpE [Chlamydiota bacterium]
MEYDFLQIASWPEEVQEAYEQAEVPSPYEILLAYEKLASEVRRQNKELRSYGNALSELPDSIHDLLQDTLSTWTTSLPQSSHEEVFTSFADSLQNITTQATSTIETLQKTLPHSPLSAFLTHKTWETLAQSLLTSLQDALQLLLNKSHSILADQGIELIAPETGDSFTATLHRAIETRSGGEAGTIAELIRSGYRNNQLVIRPADVAVYKKSKEPT